MNVRRALITAMKAPHVTQALQEMEFHVRILMNVLKIAKFVMAMLLVRTTLEATDAGATSFTGETALQATALQVSASQSFS